MKLIISQDGHQLFTCGDCQIYSLSTVEIPGKKKADTILAYSVGVAGISFGQFEEKERAAAVLNDIAAFLGSKDISYTVPKDGDVAEPTPAPEETPDESGKDETPDTTPDATEETPEETPVITRAETPVIIPVETPAIITPEILQEDKPRIRAEMLQIQAVKPYRSKRSYSVS